MTDGARTRARIDHIAFMVSPENFDSAIKSMTDLLELTFEGPYDLTDLGTKVVIDWDAGIEFITVTDPSIATAQAEFLKTHGDGFYRLVVGVGDLKAALERADAAQIGLIYQYDGLTIDPSWRDRFDRIDEAILEDPSPGIRIALGQIEPRTPPAS